MSDADLPTETEPATTRVVVLRGGEPTVEEVAALVLALTPVTVADGPADGVARSTPAWALAGLLEGVGGRRAVAPSDLVALR